MTDNENFNTPSTGALARVTEVMFQERRLFEDCLVVNTRNFFSMAPNKLRPMMKKLFASTGGSVRPVTRCLELCASTGSSALLPKMNLIIELPRRAISEIKLKRTDTTLDLSQKAKRAKEEKSL